MSLQFVSLTRKFHFSKNKITSKWICYVIKQKNFLLGDINIVFCSDDFLLNMNINYLSHKTLTDIITFDYSNDEIISGDLFLSIDRIKQNAQKFKVSFENELNRVIIHGILHLCGYKDKTKIESKLMKMQENHSLRKLSKIK